MPSHDAEVIAAKRGKSGCGPKSLCGKICCCVCVSIAIILIVLGCVIAGLYRGKPDATVKSATNKVCMGCEMFFSCLEGLEKFIFLNEIRKFSL